jgi:phosphatidate cytidylyltransferase
MNKTVLRAITGSFFAAAIFGTLYMLPPIYFSLLFLLMLLIILFNEWPQIGKNNVALWLLVPFYPAIPFALLIYMNHITEGRALLPLIFISAFCNDTGAYVIGKLFGKHPLLQSISPKKTLEGFFGGILCVILCLFFFQYFNPNSPIKGFNLSQTFLFGIAIGIIATAGDLFESLLKRQAQLKDASSLLPGHGGLLDRLDSILFLAILFYLLILI